MLIYDHNKEFIGIDQEGLKLLGYERFEDLIHEHKDVAELFVKKPGYIHNFTNFPWIDFVLHAETDDNKVIIAGKNKAFSAIIDIVPLYLKKVPDEAAFLITLKNVQNYHLDDSERPAPSATPIDLETKAFNTPPEAPPKAAEPAPFVAPEPEPFVAPEPEPFVAPEPEPFVVPEPVVEQAPLTFDDDIFIQDEEPAPAAETPAEEELDIFFHEEEVEEAPHVEVAPEIPVQEQSVFDTIKEEPKGKPMLGAYLSEEDKAYLADLQISDDYHYDPQIAADELGLPVDLIEEFIGDFIKQAHEFKDQLFTAIGNEDFDNIKVLSHKLKGVAANLRIEDSFEVLRNVNETADIKECEANLKKFYMIIAKLEGKDLEEAQMELEQPAQPAEEELYDLTPKHLDLPELEETEAAAQPVTLDTPYQDTTPAAPAVDDNSDLYDFGLIAEEGNEPLVVLDDEEEIISDLQNFEADEKSVEAPALTYDINIAAGEIGLSADLVSALIDDYIVEANEMKNTLNEVIASSDVMRWKGYATQLKGVSDNLRIKEISDVLQKLITATDQTQAKTAMQEFYGFINQL